MPEATTADDLEGLEKGRRRQRRGDRVAVTLLLAAGFAGLQARGTLGRSHCETADRRLRLEYSAVDQRAVPAPLVVRVAAGTARHGRLRIRFSDAYLRSVRVASVMPQPERVEAAEDGADFVFRLVRPERPTTIRFWVEGLELGRLEGRVGVVGGPSVRFTQYLFP